MSGRGEIPADVLDPSRALAPITVRVNEARVRRGFLPKIKRVASKIPFASDALSVFWCVRDKDTPTAAKGLMFAALAYFVLPTDVVPDFLAGIGFTDDAAVMAALLAVVGKNIKPRHKEAAEAFLEKMRAD
jgi:uncharacterized membrane protein YkvA (DUF1232 family)